LAEKVLELDVDALSSDVVIAFGIRSEGESYDLADLSLPWGQDVLIDVLATAGKNDVVVLRPATGLDALARQGVGDRAGLVSRAGGWSSHRRTAHRQGQPVRAAAARIGVVG
jgi:hypothetical protein